MPTIPLLADPTNPNGSHAVTSPGGYEGWHFDASSDDGRLHLVAALHEAWDRDPLYARRYRWYRRFPTRLRPPLPREFPAVTFLLCEAGKPTVRFAARARPGDEVRTTDDGRSVRVGASHAERSSDGSIRLHLRGTDRLRTIAANLTFRPLIRLGREVTLIDSPAAGLHRWVIVDPLCEVDGEVSIFGGAASSTPRVISFAGKGLHDHRYGTRPAPAVQWFSGRVLLDGRAIAFERIGRARLATLLSATPQAADVSSAPIVDDDRASVNIGPISLTHPTILASQRHETLLTYDARVGDERGVALCRKLRRRRWTPLG